MSGKQKNRMPILIRDARPTDLAIIADFNCRMARETEGRSLDRDLIHAGVSAVLADAGKGRYCVAVVGDQVVGQLMLTFEWSDWRNGVLWWIQSVYIEPEFRRQGVFSSLYRHVESLARGDAQVRGIRLYVENGYERAQATYLALGMRRPGYQIMEVEFTASGEP
jgi:GNAT superfamily N-acetyltransferase